jgi:hypothetical protein
MASYIVENLISRVKRWGSIPTTQPLFQQADFVSMLDEELQYAITPLIVSTKEEFFIREWSTLIVSGQKDYILPTRAIGGTFRDVMISDGTEYQDIVRVDPKHSIRYQDGYFIRGNRLHLVDESKYAGQNLVVHYPARPNNLMLSTDCAQISNIAGNVVTVTSRPSAWTTSDEFDIVQNNNPFDWLLIDQTVTLSGTDFTFSSVPDTVAVGDWICLKEESPVPQIPVEAMNLLCQGVVVKCLEALNDETGYKLADSKYQNMERALRNLMQPRATDEPQKVVNTEALVHNRQTVYYKY